MRTVGSFQCNKNRSLVCLSVKETGASTTSVTKQTYKINLKFKFSGKCLIYFLFCKKYLVQYVGKTANDFHFKWKNYRNSYRNYDRNQSCM